MTEEPEHCTPCNISPGGQNVSCSSEFLSTIAGVQQLSRILASLDHIGCKLKRPPSLPSSLSEVEPVEDKVEERKMNVLEEGDTEESSSKISTPEKSLGQGLSWTQKTFCDFSQGS